MTRNNRKFIVARFISKLSADERTYAVAPQRGDFRGFGALADIFDPNETLLDCGCPAPDGTQSRLDEIAGVISDITASLIRHYAPAAV